MSELTRERVMELRKIVRRERIDGTTAEQLSAELSALADHWLATQGDAPPGSVLATCPKCKRANNDFDGFGVLKCDFCDYCTHPSITGSTCDLCKTDCTPRTGTDEGGGRL